ncbi:uncharacterized protein LOC130647564 isoform X2 [Hydractinia symbiolongicarpus]|uniref:uncharacterized protein LOC130647564 isoform X2 n=1 Tax=Hydractinia symbiolongicarpus TaxID=13093 RepID=UPI00254C943E|nr:uncharacterized protein LOC130647564 isoform X2 [Hydractinia symbiolongicarpus]
MPFVCQLLPTNMKIVCFKLVLFYEMLTKSIETVDSLSCFTCSSDSKELCQQLQEKVACPENKNACLTLSYDLKSTSVQNAITEKVVRKRCVQLNINGCERYCEMRLMVGDKNCQAGCCTTDFCNNEMKTKRIRYKRRFRSMGIKLQMDISLSICLIVVTSICLLKMISM